MTNNPMILALDLATVTGWALGHARDEIPLFGSFRCAKAGSSLGTIYNGCRFGVAAILANHDVELVVLEAPPNPAHMAGRTNANTMRMLVGLSAIVEELLFCGPKEYQLTEARASIVRNHFLGRNPGRAVAKQQTVKKCRLLGWAVEDDNQADACAVWDYQCAMLRKDDVLRRVV